VLYNPPSRAEIAEHQAQHETYEAARAREKLLSEEIDRAQAAINGVSFAVCCDPPHPPTHTQHAHWLLRMQD
jgi:RNA polymerase-binding transcription factor DksA